MWNLKYGTDDPIYKTEPDHGHRQQTCGCQGREGRKWDGQGIWGCWMQTVTFGMDGQWASTVQHRELYVMGHFAVQQKLKKHVKSTI